MNKPTQEQTKEFWEKHNFRYEETTRQVCGVVSKCFMWRYPDGSWHESLPSIDLNNLFKYPLQKLLDEGYNGLQELLEKWVAGLSFNYDENVLALFWAIREVTKEV